MASSGVIGTASSGEGVVGCGKIFEKLMRLGGGEVRVSEGPQFGFIFTSFSTSHFVENYYILLEMKQLGKKIKRFHSTFSSYGNLTKNTKKFNIYFVFFFHRGHSITALYPPFSLVKIFKNIYKNF